MIHLLREGVNFPIHLKGPTGLAALLEYGQRIRKEMEGMRNGDSRRMSTLPPFGMDNTKDSVVSLAMSTSGTTMLKIGHLLGIRTSTARGSVIN